MCRNIKRLRGDHPPTDTELHDAALQFIRKISGYNKPSKANEKAFDAAVRDVARAGRKLFDRLEVRGHAHDDGHAHTHTHGGKTHTHRHGHRAHAHQAVILFVSAALSLACASQREASGSRSTAPPAAQTTSACEPVETRPPNVPDNEPAFPGQTRACAVLSNVAFDVVVLARGLVHPWAVEPLPDGDLLVTERPGRLRIVTAAGETLPPIEGLPAVDARGQGGLLDVALSPSFASDRTIYWTYAEPREGGNGTAAARGVLSADRTRVEQVEVLFRALPTYFGMMHFGSRLAFGPDGSLFITTGERSDDRMREHAQRFDGHLGKVLRIRADGSVPDDNPFVTEEGARAEIWSLGHRNIQAAAVDPDGRLWIIEHGPNGGDELNRVERGANYGWPLQSYGEEYSGQPIPGVATRRQDMEQPVYYWDPVIAPSGAQWYTGDAFPRWRGSLFIGGLRAGALVRLEIEDGRVTGEEHLLKERRQRVRDVRQGPDGALYVVTDEERGELWKIVPR